MISSSDILNYLQAQGKNLVWKRIDGQPCIHSANNDFHFTICLYYPNGVETMFLDVDDIKNRTGNVLKKSYSNNDLEFSFLVNLYHHASNNCELIYA